MRNCLRGRRMQARWILPEVGLRVGVSRQTVKGLEPRRRQPEAGRAGA